MKILKLKIDEFKGIKNAEITFDSNINFIVGDNNVGKTRVIEAINSFYNKEKDSKMTMTYTLNNEDIQKIKENKAFEQLNTEIISINLDDGKHKYNGIDLKTSISKDNLFGQVIYIPAVINHADEQNMGKASSHINTAFIKLISKNDELEKKLESLNANFSSYVDDLKSETTNMYKKINNNIAFNNIKVTLGKKSIQNDQIIKNNLELNVVEDGQEKEFWMVGTGIQRNIINSILSVKEDKEFVIYLYDEPETYLNITAQRKLIKSFIKNTEKCQYVIATHSPAIIQRDKNTFNRIIRLKKIEKNNIEVSQFDIATYKNYIQNANIFLKSNGVCDEKLLSEEPNNSILAWWDSNRVNAMFERKIILGEGPTEEIFLDLILDEELPYVSCIGKYKMPYFIILFQYIFKIDIICIFDSDGNKNDIHNAFNTWINYNCNSCIICNNCIEDELGYKVPSKNKEQEIIDRYFNNTLSIEKINTIKENIIMEYNK